MTRMDKFLIGCEEWCSFPSLGIPAVKARIDTGAKTSSLHAYEIEPFEQNGEEWVRFIAHPIQKDLKTTVTCTAPLIDQRLVKSSSGNASHRHVIKVPLTLGNETWDVEVTLANRDTMGYRMLLGREAMNGRVLVDPSENFLLGRLDKKQVKNFYK